MATPTLQQAPPPAPDAGPRGLIVNTPSAADGYVLFSPLLSSTTYLLDRDGAVVHTWESAYSPGASVYLLKSGSLMRTAREPDFPRFSGGGQAGRIQEFDWDGELLWEHVLVADDQLSHHDIEVLPNGNVLVIVWEHKTVDEAARKGRNPEQISDKGIWPDAVLELAPNRPSGADVVWEWHVWDHLVQGIDKRFDDFGDVAGSPGRLDINGDAERPMEYTDEEIQNLRAMGYLGGDDDAEPPDPRADWLHTNAVDYNPERDQIVLSTPRMNEIWILDHSTTTAEAATSRGGRSGRGGDILYRWGNPRTYGRGTLEHQRLFSQHDAQWIEAGLPGGGNLLVFNNGSKDGPQPYSTIVEIKPPMDDEGNYIVPPSDALGPAEPVWSYADPDRFNSPFISGAQRLANGNTLICEGSTGRFLEVTPGGEIVWEYVNPYSGDVRTKSGELPQPGLDRFPTAVYRATFIPADHPALSGRELSPLDPQPPIIEPPPPTVRPLEEGVNAGRPPMKIRPRPLKKQPKKPFTDDLPPRG
jgi:hypothetical protein